MASLEMPLSAIERLPDLVQDVLCELLHRTSPLSIRAFALASRTCHDVISPYLYRRSTLRYVNQQCLRNDIERLSNGPLAIRRFQWARVVRVDELVRQDLRREDILEEGQSEEPRSQQQPPTRRQMRHSLGNGELYHSPRPIDTLGYIHLGVAFPPSKLDHESKHSERFHYDSKSPKYLRHGSSADLDTWRYFVTFLEKLTHVNRFEWACQHVPPIIVLRALERHHPSVHVSLLRHRFCLAHGRQSTTASALAVSPLIRDISATSVDWDDREDLSSHATLKLLRTLPNLRILHLHLFPHWSMPVMFGSAIENEFGSLAGNRLGEAKRDFTHGWRNFTPPLPDTGPAKLESLIFSGNATIRPPILQMLKISIDLTCLENLDLGRILHLTVLRELTGPYILPQLRRLGIFFVHAYPELIQARDHAPAVLAFDAFLASLPRLQHFEATDLIDREMQESLLRHQGSNLDTLRFKIYSDQHVWRHRTFSTATMQEIFSQCTSLERIQMPLPSQYVKTEEIVGLLGRIRSLRFAEFDCRYMAKDAELLWTDMERAKAQVPGAQQLMGMKVNIETIKSIIITRSERNDARQNDFRRVPLYLLPIDQCVLMKDVVYET